MTTFQTILVWAFGLGGSLIMLGSLVKRRRDYLVESLRANVERRIGPPPSQLGGEEAPDPTAEPPSS